MTGVQDEDEHDELVPIPEVLRTKLTKRLQGCQRIILDVERAEGKWAKFASFKINNKPGEWPENDDEIAQEVVDRIHEHWLENNGDENSLQYRVWCTGFTKQGKRSRPSFQYIYSGPEGEERSAGDDEDDDAESGENLVIRQLLSLTNQLGLRLDEAHLHIRELAASNNKMFEPMQKVVDQSWSAYIAAMEMNKNALYVIHDVKREDRAEKARDARLEKYMHIASPALAQLAKMFGGWFMGKLQNPGGGGAGGTGPGAGGTVTGGVGPDGNVTPPWATQSASATPTSEPEPQAQTTPAPEPEQDEPAMSDEERAQLEENPVAFMATQLAGTIRPKQWQTVGKQLNKREFQAFTSLLGAETDQDVISAWDRIAGGAIGTLKLMALYGDLDEEQQAEYEQLQAAIVSRKEQLEAQPTT